MRYGLHTIVLPACLAGGFLLTVVNPGFSDDLTTAKLPDGWRERLVHFQPPAANPARALCLEKHDLVISKLVAMREKDHEFALSLLQAGLIDIDVLLARAAMLSSVAGPTRRLVESWLDSARRKLNAADRGRD